MSRVTYKSCQMNMRTMPSKDVISNGNYVESLESAEFIVVDSTMRLIIGLLGFNEREST